MNAPNSLDSRAPRHPRALAALALPLLLASCSGGDGAADTCEGSACEAPDGGAGQLDAGAPDAAVPTRTARIEIELEPPLFQGQSARTLIRGGFAAQPDPNCTPQTVGTCTVTDCTQFDGAIYAAPGRLTISPALGGDIRFDPGPFRIFFSADFIAWAANDAISIATEGEDVPAMSLSVPSPRTLDIGEGREQFNVPLVKVQSLSATWVPISEQVLLRLRQGRDTADGEYEVIVECVVPGASGAAQIPAAALSRLIPEATGGLSATLDTFAMRQSTTVAGDYAVTARVLRSFGLTIFHDVE